MISENAADMIAVVDLEGRRIFNSLSFQRILGYSPEELQVSSGFEPIHPEDRERVKKAAEEARRTGACQRHSQRTRRTGKACDCEPRHYLAQKGPGALSHSEGSFRALVEGAPYGIYRATMTGQFHERHRVGMEAAERRADRRTVLGPPRGGQGWRSRLF